jgi:hypothetical protein
MNRVPPLLQRNRLGADVVGLRPERQGKEYGYDTRQYKDFPFRFHFCPFFKKWCDYDPLIDGEQEAYQSVNACNY